MLVELKLHVCGFERPLTRYYVPWLAGRIAKCYAKFLQVSYMEGPQTLRPWLLLQSFFMPPFIMLIHTPPLPRRPLVACCTASPYTAS